MQSRSVSSTLSLTLRLAREANDKKRARLNCIDRPRPLVRFDNAHCGFGLYNPSKPEPRFVEQSAVLRLCSFLPSRDCKHVDV
jgi:hypothetical protein